METRGGVFPDVSSCQGLLVRMRSTQPYDGYRVSFGTVHVPGGRFAYGYKANFNAPMDVFHQIYIPFSDFTAKWDDATGDAIVTCREDPQYCPTKESLRNLQNLIFWGEGIAGKVHLEIISISGAQCSGAKGSWLSESAMLPTEQWNKWSMSSWTTGFIAVLMLVGLLSVFGKRFSALRRSNYTTVRN